MIMSIKPQKIVAGRQLYVVLVGDRQVACDLPVGAAMRELSARQKTYQAGDSIIESGYVHELNWKGLSCK